MRAALAGPLLVVLCAVVEGFSQVCFKKSALAPARRHFWIGTGVALFVLQAALYTVALQFVEVSTAFPIGSFAYVVVAILSRRILDEPVTRTRWLGVGFVIAGVSLLAGQA
ncbi:MAG TPA: EamA family transporter [Burkholderiales bacterium]|nr:EamA family transporter [Burkholderiales bacterium]